MCNVFFKELNKSALVDKLLPMIVMHRQREISHVNDELNSIKADRFRLNIVDFSKAYLIVFVHEE